MVATAASAGVVDHRCSVRTEVRYPARRAVDLVEFDEHSLVLICVACGSATRVTGVHEDAPVVSEAQRVLSPVVAGTAIRGGIHRVVLDGLLVCSSRISPS